MSESFHNFGKALTQALIDWSICDVNFDDSRNLKILLRKIKFQFTIQQVTASDMIEEILMLE